MFRDTFLISKKIIKNVCTELDLIQAGGVIRWWKVSLKYHHFSTNLIKVWLVIRYKCWLSPSRVFASSTYKKQHLLWLIREMIFVIVDGVPMNEQRGFVSLWLPSLTYSCLILKNSIYLLRSIIGASQRIQT